MGRIDRSGGQDKVMEKRHIEQMLKYALEYETVKRGNHSTYKTAGEFYEGRSLCKQNFLKYYRRYINSGRSNAALIPHKTGRKFKDIIKYEHEVEQSIEKLRESAYNKYDIAHLLKARMDGIVNLI